MENSTADYHDVTTPFCNVTSPYYVGKVGTFEFVLKCVILPMLTVPGLVGNILCYLVLSRERKQKSMNFLLKGLAIADSLFLVLLILFQTIPAAYGHTGWGLLYQIFYQRVGKNLIIMLQWIAKMSSIYLTIFVTIERYVAVSRPLKAQMICSLKHTKIGTFLIVFFCIVYNIPKMFYYQMFQDRYDLCMDDIMPMGDRTELYQSRLFIEIYVLGMYFVVVYIFPLLALFILNSFLIYLVRKSYRERARLGGQVSSPEKCTEKIIGIVSAFIILETPAIIVNIVYSQKKVLTDADFQALNMIYILSAINSVINFYIYVLVGKAFRDRLKEVLRCKRVDLRKYSSRRKTEDTNTSSRATDYSAKKRPQENGNKVTIAVINEHDHVTHL